MNLVPCSLCGGEAVIRKVERIDGFCHYEDLMIYCKKCGTAMGFPADGYYGREFFSKDEAIAEWNKAHWHRHGYVPVELFLEVLEKYREAESEVISEYWGDSEHEEKLNKEIAEYKKRAGIEE